MSLVASQSSRESTRYPLDSKPFPGGFPPGPDFMSRGYRVDSREDCEASRLIGCFSSSGFWNRAFEPGCANASNPCFVHQKIENPKMLRMKFWTSDFDVEKWSKRPQDPQNRIRLEKLCPKVVSDRQNAGRMTSKRRFWHFCRIMENPGQNVKFSPQPWGHPTPQSTIGFGQRVIIRSIKWLGDPPFYPCIKWGDLETHLPMS